MYVRVLSVRNHKTVSFISGYSKDFGNTQFMIDNKLFKNIKCGDLINVEYLDTFNQRNMPIKKIITINEIISGKEFSSLKGINNEQLDVKTKNLIEARNGGKPLNFLEFKKDVLYKIKEILNNLNYFDATGLTNTIEMNSNGSGIKEAEIKNREDNEPKYLRITLENQLKQMSALTLKSIYAIEKVFRNMGEDKNHINEFLMLEMVSLLESMSDVTKIITSMDNIVKELAEKNKILVSDNKLQIIDYSEIDKSSIDYEILRKSFLNTLVINYPCESPFIKKDEKDGLRKEVRWYVNGHWISHFYKDENNYDNIKEVLEKQKDIYSDKKINMLDYYEWGLPQSISLGLSIDRWLQMLCNLENINSIANPLSLDYVKRRKL
ncbi:MAG: hypothetical protein IJD92_02370 [Bacilli bacterium]|nr:hypothetical protein [Bacilli bacterium]